jgi:hypothetical protein
MLLIPMERTLKVNKCLASPLLFVLLFTVPVRASMVVGLAHEAIAALIETKALVSRAVMKVSSF